MSLVDARERHAEARKLLAAGVDPMAQRKADKAALMASEANSFKMVAQLWLAHWRVGKSERHADTTGRRLQANITPSSGLARLLKLRRLTLYVL